uniref:Uncharacterized protein n=1 Tax=Tanacetum cinerariifolium TaxID=118510 RepID=A0A6L2KXP1_TANCI|nr:hypothetical protein [Tanacetum cinerariifolium]
MPGPEEPEQAPPSPDYIPGPEHADDEIVAEDQPYAEDASPIAQSPEYVPESDFEMHPEALQIICLARRSQSRHHLHQIISQGGINVVENDENELIPT